MPQIIETIEIAAPLDKVFGVLSDPRRYAEWLTIHAGWTEEPPADVGDIKVGDVLKEKISLMGMVNKIEWTVQEFDPPRWMKITGTAMAGVRAAFTMAAEPAGESAGESAGDRTKVSIDAEFTGQLVVGALGDAVAKEARRQLGESLGRLEALVS